MAIFKNTWYQQSWSKNNNWSLVCALLSVFLFVCVYVGEKCAHTHVYRERERERKNVRVLHVSELGVSSAALIVVMQRPPVCLNNRSSLISCGWMGNMGLQHLCCKSQSSVLRNTWSWLCPIHKHAVKNRHPNTGYIWSSLLLRFCLFDCCVGKERGGGSCGCKSLIKILWVWGWSPRCFLCLCLQNKHSLSHP